MTTQITATDAMIVLQHIRALHPERAEQLSGISDFIRKQDSHNNTLRSDMLKMQRELDLLKVTYHKSLCQRVKRFFVRAKVNPNIG